MRKFKKGVKKVISKEAKSFLLNATLVLMIGLLAIWLSVEIGDAIINFKMAMSK